LRELRGKEGGGEEKERKRKHEGIRDHNVGGKKTREIKRQTASFLIYLTAFFSSGGRREKKKKKKRWGKEGGPAEKIIYACELKYTKGKKGGKEEGCRKKLVRRLFNYSPTRHSDLEESLSNKKGGGGKEGEKGRTNFAFFKETLEREEKKGKIKGYSFFNSSFVYHFSHRAHLIKHRGEKGGGGRKKGKNAVISTSTGAGGVVCLGKEKGGKEGARIPSWRALLSFPDADCVILARGKWGGKGEGGKKRVQLKRSL